MTFKELFSSFIAGAPIKRKSWGGYWKYVSDNNDILIVTKFGEEIWFSKSENMMFTISHISENDWEIATNENCNVEVI